ncbi:hypothetical protein HMPREF9337_01637 [Cutibacterium acnes HL096PA3]|uniref:Uncharacterized protein n=1 Tax=Cutibacterium acnes (strain DSM 16379 / KPA171202) TaxID=267747 RepID=Q6AAA9_CUTAK|nr:hypothetical protein PPA2402 [Cutibacterium acnes KPA171202]EFS56592.1 hypothetical protein HMPREF9593_00741 [Cutibacterium acnes HL046PA2]EFS68537.1 hypothetical protein HMPREF9616_01540 [Cutibacterium acnes HL007PA1]EFT24851.1 hypothetical protein HMPREF9577_02557 [Cutibacterium acnes HL110PA3]EGE72315.1 hypothetical protein HMPREF9337_01637 [Cutibacterium acnes HL096PA3]EGE72801.1 hypothetical protein HMPREF9344_01716 [Cutibacterium acnes HL097PA1]EGE91841.1 hypothetical protein HMPREF9
MNRQASSRERAGNRTPGNLSSPDAPRTCYHKPILAALSRIVVTDR